MVQSSTAVTVTPRARRRGRLLPCVLLAMAGAVAAGVNPIANATASAVPSMADDWVSRSNAHAGILAATYARFDPEQAGRFGVEGLDNRVVDLGLARSERRQAAFSATARELEARQAREKDPRVRQDLAILIAAADLEARAEETERRILLPVYPVPEMIYSGVEALLSPKVAPERRPAAAVRLRRYAGLEEGYTPLTVLAETRVREQLAFPGLVFPYRAEVEQSLRDADLYLDGVAGLLKTWQVKDGNKALRELRLQVAAWSDFVRAEVLPRSRDDYRLPAGLYALRLEQVGVDLPPAELVARARTAFVEIRYQLEALAPRVARQQSLRATDYREVIRGLRARQIGGEQSLALYRERLAAIEELIREQRIVTLPGRDAIIRLASPAESARVPVPQMQPPPLINNRGEQGEFVLPLALPARPGEPTGMPLTDFSFDAATWTLTAHEARPGHELQFARMVETGTSIARALFAMNSVNAEGWALYAEAEMVPYLPLDGQLIALQYRLLRAARAFLDPGLQQGEISLDEARRILTDEVVLSDAMAEQELQRYTWRAPAQAPSYFYGYQRLQELRAGTEIALGAGFDRQRFNDFVLAQGLLPPSALAAAVADGFIPAERRRKQQADDSAIQ